MVTRNSNKIISHQQLREYFSHLKNFDAWIAFLRRIKILPPSVRKGNIAGLKRGNIGVHPEQVVGFLEKILKLRAQPESYDEIKKELKGEIKDLQFLYSAENVIINDPRAKSDELLKTYSTVLKVLEEYYGWEEGSYNSRFYRKIADEFDDALHDYIAAKMVVEETVEEGKIPKFKLVERQKMADRHLDLYYDTIYFIIRQYEKLRKERKVKDIKRKG